MTGDHARFLPLLGLLLPGVWITPPPAGGAPVSAFDSAGGQDFSRLALAPGRSPQAPEVLGGPAGTPPASLFGASWKHEPWDCSSHAMYKDSPYGCRPGVAAIEGGGLVLKAWKGTTGGAQVETVSKSYLYGEYVARIKAVPATPKGEGVCQGFFFYSDKDQSEIDVEILSREPGKVHFVLHSGPIPPAGLSEEETREAYGRRERGHFVGEVSGQSEGYHDYGFRWTPERVEFLADGKVAGVVEDHVPVSPGKLVISQWSGKADWTGLPVRGSGTTDLRVADVRVTPYAGAK